jgi:hypothetical protein
MAYKKKNFKTIIESKMKKGLGRFRSQTMPSDVYESREWFRQKAIRTRSLKTVNSRRIMQIGRNNRRLRPTLKTRMMLGKLFMFEYEAKGAETLPYYDAFPIIFPIESYTEGFLGINLHYLPYLWRAHLMDNLYELRTNEDMDETTRLKLFNNGYDILKRSPKYKYFRPCVKRYLDGQVTSRYMEIPPDEWEIALFLPLERFIGESKRGVWKDTRKKYRKSRGRG